MASRLSEIEDNLNRGIYDGQVDGDISWLLSEYHRLNACSAGPVLLLR